jgi:hypothetical protein
MVKACKQKKQIENCGQRSNLVIQIQQTDTEKLQRKRPFKMAKFLSNKIYSFCCLLILLLLGCHPTLNSEMLVGAYYCNQNSRNDSIYLFKDATYKHVHIASNGQTVENKGKWEYDHQDHEIVFYNFVFLTDQNAYHEQIKINTVGGK